MQYPDDISPQGAALLFNEGGASRDLWVLSNGKPQPLLVTPASERGGAFSPDGAWIAFTSDESGRDESISSTPTDPANRGLDARWIRPNVVGQRARTVLPGGERPMVVRVGAMGDLSVPERLFNVTFAITDNNQPTYDVAADGRFLMVEEVPGGRRPELRVILNWIEEVK